MTRASSKVAQGTSEQEQAGLIASHHAWQAYRADRAAHVERERAWLSRATRERSAYNEALARWRAEVTEAAAAGQAAPPRPEPARSDAEHFATRDAFDIERRRLQEREQAVLVAIAAEIVTSAAPRIAAAVEVVRDLLAQIETQRRAAGRDLADVARVRQAVDARRGQRRSHRSAVTTDDLISAAEHGTDLLADVPIPAQLGLSVVQRDGVPLRGFEGVGLTGPELGMARDGAA